MGKLTNLKSFPQFSVDFGDDSSSKTITESALFALDSLLYVMNLSLPIQTYPNALIAFSLHHTHPVCYRESNLSLAIFDKRSSTGIAYAGVPGFPVGQFISLSPLVKNFHKVCVK